MKIRFQVDADRLTLNDLIALEEENKSPRIQRDFLARFVVNGDGKYLPDDEAQEMVGNLSFTELLKALEQFQGAIEELTETTIPKVSD